MAIIKCPECGKEISDQAPGCPGCGFPIAAPAPAGPAAPVPPENPGGPKRKGKKKLFLILAAVALVLAAAAVTVVIINPHEHKYEKSVVETATCYREGTLKYTCTVCGDTKTEAIPMNNDHNMTVSRRVNATCETDGYVEHECTNCGYSFRETIGKTGHQWQAATCLSAKTCTKCGKKEGSPAPHACYANGVCSVCGAFFESSIDYSKFDTISRSATIYGEVKNIVIKSGVTYTCYGMITGSVIVESGGRLDLYGLVGESLILLGNGKANVYGTIGRNAYGNGTLDLSGILGGSAARTLTVRARKGCYINGYKYEKEELIKPH